MENHGATTTALEDPNFSWRDDYVSRWIHAIQSADARSNFMQGPGESRDWVELKIRVSRFPPWLTTWELYRMFSFFGEVSKIDLQTKLGAVEGQAVVFFCPPPKYPIWEMSIEVPRPEGGVDKIITTLLPKPRSFYHTSPVDPTRYYKERMTLDGQALQLGIMHSESAMMVMKVIPRTSQTPVSFLLNLLRREIEITFPLKDPFGDADSTIMDTFIIRVPLAKLERIYECGNDDTMALIIPLSMPPEYYRKTHDVKATHDEVSTWWSSHRTWLRQTNPENEASAPLGLRKDGATLDLGRWITYRLEFPMSKEFKNLFGAVKMALADYNVMVISNDQKSIRVLSRKDTTIWRMLDLPAASGGSHVSLFESMVHGVKGLSFAVRYQLEVCMSHGLVHEVNVTENFLRRLTQMDPERATAVLEAVADGKRRFFNPMDIFELPAVSFKKKIPPYCELVRSAIVTPTTLYFATPVLETSNRVTRWYASCQDRFLRVKFTDELNNGRLNSRDDDSHNKVYSRIIAAMKQGIRVGHRTYEFLAFGNSQFREHGAYFFSPTAELTLEDMRQRLGDLTDLKVPAKFCARLGQNFSTTRAINTKVTVDDSLDDVERNGHCFTDGVGQISTHLAAVISTELNLVTTDQQPPSLFQFRLGGCKGVLAVEPHIPENHVRIRPSQYKFPAVHQGLEIIRSSHFVSASLNRQIILVLSALGVPDDIFLNKLDDLLQNLNYSLVDQNLALSMMQKYVDFNRSTLMLASMILDGFMTSKEPFMMSMLELWRSWSIKYLKEKAKILVDKGAFLLGCVDETATLQGHFDHNRTTPHAPIDERVASLPEIFLKVDSGRDGEYEVIEGLCILARNPSLYPGDIRVVRAVDNPLLHHLKNVVVLPQTGDRDLGNMCSGGDLDGDDYIVIWDEDLLPEEWNHPAMDFTPPKPTPLDRNVTVDDIIEFFVTYMKNDRLPMIAHSHLATADASDFGVKDQKCTELAQLHSCAVDYPKSGIPAIIPRHLRPRMWPHFMEKRHIALEQQYHSKTVLGKLYDAVERVSFTPVYDTPFDGRILEAYKLDQKTLDAAGSVKIRYDASVRRVMAQHGVETEFEIFSAFVLSHNTERQDYTFAEELGRIMGHIRDRFREEVIEKAGGKEWSKLAPFIVAMYTVTAEEVQAATAKVSAWDRIVAENEEKTAEKERKSKQMPFMSFPWIFDKELGRIANGICESPGEDLMRHVVPKHMARSSLTLNGGGEIETDTGVTECGGVLKLFGDAKTAQGADAQDVHSQLVTIVDELHGAHSAEETRQLVAPFRSKKEINRNASTETPRRKSSGFGVLKPGDENVAFRQMTSRKPSKVSLASSFKSDASTGCTSHDSEVVATESPTYGESSQVLIDFSAPLFASTEDPCQPRTASRNSWLHEVAGPDEATHSSHPTSGSHCAARRGSLASIDELDPLSTPPSMTDSNLLLGSSFSAAPAPAGATPSARVQGSAPRRPINLMDEELEAAPDLPVISVTSPTDYDYPFTPTAPPLRGRNPLPKPRGLAENIPVRISASSTVVNGSRASNTQLIELGTAPDQDFSDRVREARANAGYGSAASRLGSLLD
ncbi:RdRP-domain-containing protein [Trichodelitschia bisporula]|uniref:RNA-directed RNA polymerase n=1 Tax=Trichodelitschia bisporula TaxID=703511 RepID=A0A6G1HWQ1_9PEZI|nr:RdRP-domain-containing protein [Trichodelitschia bisporula]